jgi:hypothetical protein
MVSFSQDSKGNYRARKRLPDDVRDDYGRLYGPSSEAKFSRKADTKPHVERREFNEWLSDVEARIANIRAQRNGEGQVLTRQQTRALAGEWYEWFLARHSSSERNFGIKRVTKFKMRCEKWSARGGGSRTIPTSYGSKTKN